MSSLELNLLPPSLQRIAGYFSELLVLIAIATSGWEGALASTRAAPHGLESLMLTQD